MPPLYQFPSTMNFMRPSVFDVGMIHDFVTLIFDRKCWSHCTTDHTTNLEHLMLSILEPSRPPHNYY